MSYEEEFSAWFSMMQRENPEKLKELIAPKEVSWWEVRDTTSQLTFNEYDDEVYDNEAEVIGRYSTLEEGRKRLQKWADDKGIEYPGNTYVTTWYENDEYARMPKKVLVTGLFYEHDEPVGYNDDWTYASYATLSQERVKLSEDI